MSAASLATSVAASSEMPTSAACRATASLTPSPRKATSAPVRRAGELDDPGFLVGADPGEHGGVPDRGCQRAVVEPLQLGAGVDLLDVQAKVAADLGGDHRVVAGDDLDRDAEGAELGDRGAGVGLGAVDEGEEAGQVQAVLVGRSRDGQPGRLAGGDGDDAGAVGEQPRQGRLRVGPDVRAAVQDGFGCALGDQQRGGGGGADGHRGELTVVVDGASPRRW
jgi:hypothetical protein